MNTANAVPATVRRRLGCASYEALSITVLIFLGAFPLSFLTHNLDPSLSRPIWQLFILLLPGMYLTWCWRRGQTLAMSAWGLRIESAPGQALSRKQAWLRYLYACLLLLPLGMGWWSAWLRKDGLFLHDHLAGTRLLHLAAVTVVPATKSPPAPPE